jgi:hypothetical protein
MCFKNTNHWNTEVVAIKNNGAILKTAHTVDQMRRGTLLNNDAKVRRRRMCARAY